MSYDDVAKLVGSHTFLTVIAFISLHAHIWIWGDKVRRIDEELKKHLLSHAVKDSKHA